VDSPGQQLAIGVIKYIKPRGSVALGFLTYDQPAQAALGRSPCSAPTGYADMHGDPSDQRRRLCGGIVGKEA